ncbi:MAG TPA: Eco57I restriction-modification methylase domain-containing protein [bacterium]|nr:Eco57I restriction-modification methylase domain-containing protein [bacterium]
MIKEIVGELVERFKQNIDTYKSASYNETELRVEFINPFWKALGWDVDNKAGYAHLYRDVIHEDAISFGGSTKAPDYCFRIGNMRKFFLEAKRPSVNIGEDATSAYQLRRYAWSGKLPISVLTNFAELAVYDGRIRPSNTDKASKARIALYKFDEYVERWDEIDAVFSREAVLKGSFDKYALSVNGKRGTTEVDMEFLTEIEKWRESLAKNIALRNVDISVRDLNFAIQMTIDRIIFLRMCEDRGIEKYGQLQALCSGKRIYSRLIEIFEKADDKYNSGLFHFRLEKERDSAPDRLTTKLTIDDKVLKEILLGLYYPESPYEFGVIPTEILGNVYEQFLGKVIRLTKGRQAKVEEKPEIRKAGGVYYTPQYIVEHIVKNTVGSLCEGKTPDDISRIRILDPACGSGSFLLEAYNYLLDYHLKWYLEKKEATGKAPLGLVEKSKPKRGRHAAIYEARKNEWLLTTREKKRILLNSIYGVDIDSQAVEVAKLSLFLKVLENENQETLRTQLALWRERALPDLSGNIKCGNSLIGPEINKNGQLIMFDEAQQGRVNVFDWHDSRNGFGDIMKAGGFDCIVGNPPYIRIQALKDWAPIEVEHYKKHYKSASSGNYDIYAVFVEKGLTLLNSKGRLGFILPHKFFNLHYGKQLRGIIADGKHLSEIIHFGSQQVFAGPTTYTCILFLDKAGNKRMRFVKVDDLDAWRKNGESEEVVINAKKISSNEWNFIIGDGNKLFEKLENKHKRFGDVCDMFVGLQTSADDVFIMDFVKKTEKTITLRSKALGEVLVFEKDLFFPLVSGQDINAYFPLGERQYILFPYNLIGESAELIDYAELQRKYPKASNYLERNKERLEKRENGRFKGPKWYCLYPKNLGIQNRVKLCVPRLVERLHAGYDIDGRHFNDNVDVGGVTLKSDYREQTLEYLLCLMNSNLLRWHFSQISTTFRGGWRSANRQFIEKLPFRTIDFYNKNDVKAHRKIVSMTMSMLDCHSQLLQAKTPDEEIRTRRLIAANEIQMNNLVYELYGINKSEIEIIESEK